MKYLLIVLFLTGCNYGGAFKGQDGLDGAPGANAHSLVTTVTNVPPGAVCPNGGESLDVYADIDDSMTVSSPDIFESSLVTCNGANGATGATGPQGATGATGATGASGSGAVITAYSQTVCTPIAGTIYFYKQNGAKKAGIFKLATCTAASKLINLTNSVSSVWLGVKVLAEFDNSTGNANGIRVVTFN